MLHEYLYKIDRQAQKRFCRIVKQLKMTQGITEQLKAGRPMEWIGQIKTFGFSG